MDDKKKTKAQLISELEELHQQITEMKTVETISNSNEVFTSFPSATVMRDDNSETFGIQGNL